MVHVRGHHRGGVWVEPHYRGDRARSAVVVPPPAPVRSSWQYRDDDFTRPSQCPVCRADVFFVRHNGGRVWFDELRPPWPKHGCFDEAPSVTGYRSALLLPLQPQSLLGVILETVVTRPGIGGRIAVRCSDGRLIDAEFETSSSLSGLAGLLVVVTRSADGWIRLHAPSPRPAGTGGAVAPHGPPNQALQLTRLTCSFSATHSPPGS